MNQCERVSVDRFLPYFMLFTFLLFFLLSFSLYAVPSPNSDAYKSVPPFVAQDVGKPNVIIALDISGSMKQSAYTDTSAGTWHRSTTIQADFDPDKEYFGYFESNTQYSYSTTSGVFIADAAGAWDGDFLNWMTMRRMDVARKVLVGGKVRNRAGETIGGSTKWVIEGQSEPYDRTFRKRYSNSDQHTPFPDNTVFQIDEDGSFSPLGATGAVVVPLASNLEVGKVTMDWTNGQTWESVTFVNSYSNPIVVASSISNHGSDPVVVRVKDITSTGFQMALQEWDYLDGNHAEEDIVYIVAERGEHSLTTDSGSTFYYKAGEKLTSQVVPSLESINFSSSFPAIPVIFAGIGSNNLVDPSAVTSRMSGVGASGFSVALQEEEDNDQLHDLESVQWIAMTELGLDTIAGIELEIGLTGDTVSHVWHNINFATTFPDNVMVHAGMQTTDGSDTANVRLKNPTKDLIQVQISEERSKDSEISHTSEDVGYLAIADVSSFYIRVVVDSEPTGIVQDNSGGMRIGLAVYNYDHTINPDEIYNNNDVHGGTFRPCYPDVSLDPGLRSNFDICLDTHVKSPIDNIVQVIEEYPLIWGTTPIAETLYDIWGYVKQHDYNRGPNSHTQWYNNGTESTATPMNSYEISNDWDPYYYTEESAKLPCAKSFVLHFNDGAPYTDFNGSGHPAITNDTVGPSGQNEALDDLALMLRKTDCRGDIGEHQEIITYYVYAALGEGEVNNTSTKRMREAAANGGFVDLDNDHSPDPKHPNNFITYFANNLNGTPENCPINEWDRDGDCNPDTFYNADDGYELVAELNAAFQSISRRASSGGAASVIAASASGEGAVYQAIFEPTKSLGVEQVTWAGTVHALLVDASGTLVNDGDGDQTLDDYSIDKIIDMCFDAGEKTVRVKLSTAKGDRPTEAETSDCSNAVFDTNLFDVDYLWNGGDWLANLTDLQTVIQRNYNSTAAGRHILTSIDGGNSQVDFVSGGGGTFDVTNSGLLQAADKTEADKIVDYIRGEDQTGYRNRTLGTQTWKLGDIIYSTPTVIGRPSEALDILYNDSSYRTFLNTYKNRRQVVVAGANDGMLHAFNGGWYNSGVKKFEKGYSGDLQWDLGAEIWAYIPYNLLPHLKYLTDPDYGVSGDDHLYFVDLKPRIFDAKIFCTPSIASGCVNGQSGVEHPSGWGTVLVVGMRFGGGPITVEVTPGDAATSATMRSAYIILDVTDPEIAPQLLKEFTHANMGFTVSRPTPVVIDSDGDRIGDKWYLLMGSGPTDISDAKSSQNARLFLLDLKSMALEPAFGSSGVLTLSESNSFISDLTAVDYDLDFSADVIYFGTVTGSAAPWGGQLKRIQLFDRVDSSGPTPINVYKTPLNWSVTNLYNVNKPITARPSVSFDMMGNKWVLAGTGRFLTRADASDTSVQSYFGVKEPVSSAGSLTWADDSGMLSSLTLADVSNTAVEASTGILANAPTLTPALPISPNFIDLESRIIQFSNATNYLDGWQIDLSAGKRILGQGTVFGDTLTFTTYTPSATACDFEGVSSLRAVTFTTGTANPLPLMGTYTSGGKTYVQTEEELGIAPALSPSLHVGSDYDGKNETKAFIQTSTGKIVSINQQNRQDVQSGEVGWRQLK